MEKQRIPETTLSDESLVLRARTGDRNAFAELWLRHARSGVRIARQFTSSIDADDLVSEAYARIYRRVLSGGGPNGAFRPYLYTTIRNLASRWGQARHEVNVDDLDEVEDRQAADDPASVALDRTLTARAFRSLPERWQSVLWYTEVEGMDPHEVAPILGISANSVAALSYRAREGLRKAWLQAHVSDASATAPGECSWTIGRLGDYARRGLSPRDHQRVSDHLAECTRCSIISEEVDDVGSRLALVVVPLLLGGVVGGSVLASLSAPSSAVAASAAPAMPPAFGAVGVAATPVASAGLTASAVCAPLVGTLAIALAVAGGLAASNPAPPVPPQSTSVVQTAPSPAPVSTSLGETPPGTGEASQTAPQTGADAAPVAGSLSSVGAELAPMTQPLDSAVGAVVGGVETTVGGPVAGLPDPVTTPVPGLNDGSGVAAAVPEVPAVVPGVAAAIAPTLGSSATPGAVSIPLSGILGQ